MSCPIDRARLVAPLLQQGALGLRIEEACRNGALRLSECAPYPAADGLDHGGRGQKPWNSQERRRVIERVLQGLVAAGERGRCGDDRLQRLQLVESEPKLARDQQKLRRELAVLANAAVER
ncbi:hypothetical protein ACMHYB_00810 [Sorangium sp. So ce1128]